MDEDIKHLIRQPLPLINPKEIEEIISVEVRQRLDRSNWLRAYCPQIKYEPGTLFNILCS